MNLLLRSAASIALILIATLVYAGSPVFTTDAGAIRGYDPVAYFTEEQAVKGSADIRHEWNGAVWHFSSEANRDLFASNPERYAPQYGGHCAYAMSTGKLVSTDPEAWYVVDDKLYLNYTKKIQQRWLKDVPGFIAKADGQWAAKHAE